MWWLVGMVLLGWVGVADAATTFYLREAQTSGLSFTDGGTFPYRDLSTSAGSSAATAVTNTVGIGSQIRVTKTAGGDKVRWMSGPLQNTVVAAGSTFTITLYGFESNVAANATWRVTMQRYIAGSGSLQNIASSVPYATELGTTNAAVSIVMTTSSQVTFLNQDRLAIDLRIDPAGTMGGGHTVTLTYDHNVANGAESLVTSSVTLPAFVSPTTTPTKTATPSPTATFTPGGGVATPSPTRTPTPTRTPVPTPTTLVPQGDIEPFRLRAPKGGPVDGYVPCYDDEGGHFEWCTRQAMPTATSVTPTATPTVTRTPTPTITVTQTPMGCSTPGNVMYGIDPGNEPKCTSATGCGGRIVIFGSSYVWEDSKVLYYTGAG